MPIKNYTTNIDVYQSLGEIQGALAKNGACKIMVDYNDKGKPVSITFGLNTPNGAQAFKLPANVDGVYKVMEKQKTRPTREQAERTTWRNIRDWVLAQVAIIESGMALVDEVFLPYLTNRSGETLYQAYTNGQLQLEAKQ